MLGRLLPMLLVCRVLPTLGGTSSRERLVVPVKLGLARRLALEGPRTSRLLREPLLTRRCKLAQLPVLDLQGSTSLLKTVLGSSHVIQL